MRHFLRVDQRGHAGQQRHARRDESPTRLLPVVGGTARASVLQPTRAAEGDRDGQVRSTLPLTEERGERGVKPTLRQTCSRPKPRAQFAFKDSMIHGILQFTLRIAFRCVLHRYGSQDIRC